MEIKELFLTYIKQRELELLNKKYKFSYPTGFKNLLEQEFQQAPTVLNNEELHLLYFHYCRNRVLPSTEIKNTYTIWDNAYQKQASYMDRAIYNNNESNWKRLDGLLLFGYDLKSKIEKNNNFDDYSKFRKLYLKIGTYVSLAGIIKKPIQFSKFSEDEQIVNRISKILIDLKFIQDESWDGTYNDNPYHYNYLNFTFWGVVFVLVLSDMKIAKNTINQFKKANHLPQFEKHMEILKRLEDTKNQT